MVGGGEGLILTILKLLMFRIIGIFFFLNFLTLNSLLSNYLLITNNFCVLFSVFFQLHGMLEGNRLRIK